MKDEDVKAEWIDTALNAGWFPQQASATREALKLALAAVIPLIQEDERKSLLDLVENTPCPGEADDTETGHRYAAGYRDASQAARDELRRLREAIRARGEP
jgi:Arc/MetJ-type ribon-helix-helix transcriptional regulator